MMLVEVLVGGLVEELEGLVEEILHFKAWLYMSMDSITFLQFLQEKYGTRLSRYNKASNFLLLNSELQFKSGL